MRVAAKCFNHINNVPLLILYIVLMSFIYFFILRNFNFSHFNKKHDVPEPNPRRPDVLDLLNFDCENQSNSGSSTTSSPFYDYSDSDVTLKYDSRALEDQILYSLDRCAEIEKLFHFSKTPLSVEEAEFPLAYGVLAYKDVIQVLFMLSSFYHPQNEYCIAVGQNSGTLFHHLLRDLTKCWPNVHFMTRPPIHWGSHEIINSAYTCMEFLAHLKTDWKYFQYLSGVDVPLKTNLEMVRILKALNGTANVEIQRYQSARLRGKQLSDAPLPLFKSSLSALVPRAAANQMVATNIPRELLAFLRGTGIADEGFWGTLLANKNLYNIPGSIDGKKWLEVKNASLAEDPQIEGKSKGLRYYVSRHQLWEITKKKCQGHLSAGSCVFGLGDLPTVMASKALVAHKFYMKAHPAGFFCVLKKIRKRTENPTAFPFETSFYENLPQVELTRGIEMENVTHKELMF